MYADTVYFLTIMDIIMRPDTVWSSISNNVTPSIYEKDGTVSGIHLNVTFP